MAGNKPFNKPQTETRERDPQLAGLKVPPHSIEAEQSVLGGLMLDNERWDDVAERVVADDFYTRPHRHIFTEMARLQESGSPIDLITLAESLERQGQLDSVGGFAYLAELSKNTPSAANISAYADIVRERAVVREMISVANEIAKPASTHRGEPAKKICSTSPNPGFKKSPKVGPTKTKGPKNIADVLDATVARIEQLFQQPHDGVTGVNTGYDDLNKKTAGLQPSDLIIVAARPSMGKTTFAMNLVENAAMLQDKPVLIFSLEMPSEQIMMRSLASLSRVDQTRIRTGQLDDEDWARISGTMGILLEKRNIYIDDSSGLTPTEVRSRARRIAREHGGIGLIMIDYLQLMRVPSLSDNRTLEIAEISRSLKALAKELQVPVVALSQLNRSLEQRADKRPVNSDLRESGSIEQDADLIMFIYRDEVYPREQRS
ncbi:replicative DNA helicase [Klebsiella pneumoniae]|nr:replicative DNA helicase [Klebsiella pneumoniae]